MGMGMNGGGGGLPIDMNVTDYGGDDGDVIIGAGASMPMPSIQGQAGFHGVSGGGSRRSSNIGSVMGPGLQEFPLIYDDPVEAQLEKSVFASPPTDKRRLKERVIDFVKDAIYSETNDLQEAVSELTQRLNDAEKQREELTETLNELKENGSGNGNGNRRKEEDYREEDSEGEEEYDNEYNDGEYEREYEARGDKQMKSKGKAKPKPDRRQIKTGRRDDSSVSSKGRPAVATSVRSRNLSGRNGGNVNKGNYQHPGKDVARGLKGSNSNSNRASRANANTSTNTDNQSRNEMQRTHRQRKNPQKRGQPQRLLHTGQPRRDDEFEYGHDQEVESGSEEGESEGEYVDRSDIDDIEDDELVSSASASASASASVSRDTAKAEHNFVSLLAEFTMERRQHARQMEEAKVEMAKLKEERDVLRQNIASQLDVAYTETKKFASNMAAEIRAENAAKVHELEAEVDRLKRKLARSHSRSRSRKDKRH